MSLFQHQGISFFEIGEHNIKVVVSFATGLERVFVDDELVSKSRNFRLSSKHRFNLDGQQVEVRIVIGSIFKGPIDISLFIDDVYHDADEWDYARIMGVQDGQKKYSWWLVLLIIFVFGLAGGVAGYIVGGLLATAFKG